MSALEASTIVGVMTFSSLHLPYRLFFPFQADHSLSPWIPPVVDNDRSHSKSLNTFNHGE